MSMKLPFFKNKQIKVLTDTEFSKVPHHLAIIMDGNGRWAKKRGLPRIAGHKAAMDVVQNTVRTAIKYDIKILTLFTFSTENWKRPRPEVDFLMKLPKEFLHVYLPELIENNVRIETIGDFDGLPEGTKKVINHAKEKTRNNDGLLLNFAINYGGRFEIMEAVKQLAADIENKELQADAIDESVFSRYLFTNGLPDPDLLIRTSGEQRLSNFLLWQLAYSEFWFTDTLWPDFNETIFYQALLEYDQRIRRYGGL